MGKTKIKTIGVDELENKKAAKLGQIEVARGDAEEGPLRRARSASEDGRRETEAAGPRAEGQVSSALAPSEQPKKLKRSDKTKKQSKQRSKKYQEAKAKVDPQQKYPLNEAIKLVQEVSYSKFEGTLEAHLNTNAKNLRGLVSLPFLVGKKLTILAFPSTNSGQAADFGENVIPGNEETINDIVKGKFNFDVVVTTPEWMPKLAKCAKILGPRGLMPNPKSGTITDNLAKTITELQGGKTEYKTESNGQVIHLSIGKVSQKEDEIGANIKTLVNTIGKSKIAKITLAPTMGPGVRIDLGSI